MYLDVAPDGGLKFLGLFFEGKIGLKGNEVLGDDSNEELVEFVGEGGEVLVIGVFFEEFSQFAKVKVGGHELFHGVEHGVLHHFEVCFGGGFGGLKQFLEFLYHGSFACSA
jgi:hypothetical protein